MTKTAEERIAHAEMMSDNEALEAGRAKSAEKALAKSQYWLDVANKLRGWS